MTGTELKVGTRMLLQEVNTQKSWTDSEIRFGLNAALNRYSTLLAQGSGGYYYKRGTLSVTAGVDTVALPSDCNGHIDFLTYNNYHLRPLLLRKMQGGETGTPYGFNLTHNDILLYPSPTADITLNIGYWYLPTTITDTNESNEVDFPKAIAQLLVYKAAIICGIKHEAFTDDMKAEEASMLETLEYMRGVRIHLRSEKVRTEDEASVGFWG